MKDQKSNSQTAKVVVRRNSNSILDHTDKPKLSSFGNAMSPNLFRHHEVKALA